MYAPWSNGGYSIAAGRRRSEILSIHTRAILSVGSTINAIIAGALPKDAVTAAAAAVHAVAAGAVARDAVCRSSPIHAGASTWVSDSGYAGAIRIRGIAHDA